MNREVNVVAIKSNDLIVSAEGMEVNYIILFIEVLYICSQLLLFLFKVRLTV